MAECQHVLSAFWGGTHWLGEWLWAWATAGRWVSRQLCGQWGWVSFRLCSPRQGTLFWHTYWALHSSPPSHPLICPGTLQSSTFKEIIPWEEGETYSSNHGKTPLGVDGRPHSTMTEGEECAGAFVLKESAPGEVIYQQVHDMPRGRHSPGSMMTARLMLLTVGTETS